MLEENKLSQFRKNIGMKGINYSFECISRLFWEEVFFKYSTDIVNSKSEKVWNGTTLKSNEMHEEFINLKSWILIIKEEYKEYGFIL